MENQKRPTVYVVLIGRVSSTKQGLQGDSLDQQEDVMSSAVNTLASQLNADVKVDKTFPLIKSASGGIELQPLLEVLEYFKKPKHKISFAIVKSIDRSTRGGAEVYSYIKREFSKYGVRLIDSYGVISTQTVNTLGHLGVEYAWSKREPSYIAEILMAEQAKNEVGDILTRMIGAEIGYVRSGYRVRPAPPGYMNQKQDTAHGKRTILVPHPEEANWFIKMFELRARGGLTDAQIVDEINKMGYHSRIQNRRDRDDRTMIIGKRGGVKLKVKQFLRYIQNPIYAAVNTEKWANGSPIKCQFEGLVTIDLWNQANKGKITIVESESGIQIRKGMPKEWMLRKNKNNPLYPYKHYVNCAMCRKPMLASASTGKGGKPRPAYHCSRNHSSYRIKLQTFNDTIEDFCKKVQFTDEFKQKFKTVLLEEWHKREKTLSGDQSELHKLIAKCVEEVQGIKDTIKMSRNESVIRMLEADIVSAETKKLDAEVLLSKKETEKLKVEVFINETEYYMEHLHELLLDKANPLKSAAMFGLLFSNTPTYDDLKNGTPDLAPIFKLNDVYSTSKEQFVSRLGFEPRTKSLKGFCSTIELSALKSLQKLRFIYHKTFQGEPFQA